MCMKTARSGQNPGFDQGLKHSLDCQPGLLTSPSRSRWAVDESSPNGANITRVQNRSRQVGNEVQHKRSLCGEAGGHSHTGGRANLFPAEIEERSVPRPLGGEGK